MSTELSSTWSAKIASVLADTFTKAEIITLTNSFGAVNKIEIQYENAPDMTSKMTVAQGNLAYFSVSQAIQFLKEIVSDDNKEIYSYVNFRNVEKITKLLDELKRNFPDEVAPVDTKVALKKVKEFGKYEGVYENWERAICFFNGGYYQESLNNARLALEWFFKGLFNNSRSLENQNSFIGEYLSDQSKEFRNLVISHKDTYKTFQNEDIKHGVAEGIGEEECRYILNVTLVVMRYFENKSKQNSF